MLVIPEKFNRNNPAVRAMGSPADTGLRLLRYICERIGVDSLTGLDVLDLGCGSRFADAIVNRDVQLNSYVGIDVYKEMIDFLAEHTDDPRLRFFHIDAHNPEYNPTGIPLSENTVLPMGKQKFDVICMYSLITHQLPNDAAVIFKLLRRHVKDDGHLFFSAAVEDGKFGYREQFPDAPTALSVYTLDLITELLDAARWRVLSFAKRVPGGLPNQETLVCAPT
jgi:SAM-dependent methyltransferase